MIVLQQIKLITRPLNPSFNMHVKGLENFQRHWRSRHPPRPIPRAGDGATSALTGPFLTVGEANKPGALMVFQRMPISLSTQQFVPDFRSDRECDHHHGRIFFTTSTLSLSIDNKGSVYNLWCVCIRTRLLLHTEASSHLRENHATFRWIFLLYEVCIVWLF